MPPQFYLAQIVFILAFLHSERIVYRDLRPDSLLIDTDGYLKLADLGSAKQLAMGERTFTVLGHPNYTAPEILTKEGHNYSVDWWSPAVTCPLHARCMPVTCSCYMLVT